MSETKEAQLSLPYEDTSKLVAGRDSIRKMESIKAGNRVSSWVPFNEISERHGFNKRTDYGDLRSLADWIKNHKNELPEPMILDVLKDGRKQIVRGHRRYRACLLLIDEGVFPPDTLIEFFANKTTVSEYQKMADQYLSNNGAKQYTPLEAAEVAHSLKFNFGEKKTDEDVAKSMGISRQTVTNYISIASQDDSVKNEIRVGNMTMKEALSLITDKRKNDKAADKKEEESHITSASAPSAPEDPLKTEMEELKVLEGMEVPQETEEQMLEAQANRERIEKERLATLANEVVVGKEELEKHYNKRLATAAIKSWIQDFVDEDNGEVVGIERNEVVLLAEAEINDESIQTLIKEGVRSVFIYKEMKVSPSVITEPVAKEEKLKYDSDRPEIAQIQNAIKLNDRAATRIAKLEISDGDKKDLLNFLEWQMKDILEVREWIHNNKKQNKLR